MHCQTFQSCWLVRSLLTCSLGLLATLSMLSGLRAQETTTPPSRAKLDIVVPNAPDEPRATPLTREAMKQYIEDLKQRTPRIPLPELSDEDKKRSLEDARNFGYEARLRNLFLQENAGGGYNGFGGSPRNPPPGANRANTPADPKLSLDYAFKVRMFWIAARGNNCQYCLGHQESKLLAAGMNEDSIAALDSDWSAFPESEQAAFALARRLTTEPHLICDADIDACKKFYSDLQVLEMIGSVAGNNAINRWKEGTGSPQSTNGGNFGPTTATNPAVPPHDDTHSYLTPTSPKFAKAKTRVAKLDAKAASLVSGITQIVPTQCVRPELEVGDALTQALQAVATRKNRLPLTSDVEAREALGELVPQTGTVPPWMRLLANFPVAGKRFVVGLRASQVADELSPKLQAEINWVIARQDRAWYAVSLAKQELAQQGATPAEIEMLDGDISVDAKSDLSQRDRALLTVAKNLAASPIVLTDRQVARAVELAGARAVVQTINYTTYRAAFDRITEAAGLSN
jgi:hypothetical protein